MRERTLQTLGIALVILHLAAVLPHSIAHMVLHINVNTWQNIYIAVVILISPILAGVLIWRRSRWGFTILTVSMAGSFLFGVYYHFIANGTDNVATLPPHPWTPTFQISAAMLAIIELIALVTGLFGMRSAH